MQFYCLKDFIRITECSWTTCLTSAKQHDRPSVAAFCRGQGRQIPGSTWGRDFCSFCLPQYWASSGACSCPCAPDGEQKAVSQTVSSSLLCLEGAVKRENEAWRLRDFPWVLERGSVRGEADPGRLDSRFLLKFLNYCHPRAQTQNHTII